MASNSYAWSCTAQSHVSSEHETASSNNGVVPIQMRLIACKSQSLHCCCAVLHSQDPTTLIPSPYPSGFLLRKPLYSAGGSVIEKGLSRFQRKASTQPVLADRSPKGYSTRTHHAHTQQPRMESYPSENWLSASVSKKCCERKGVQRIALSNWNHILLVIFNENWYQSWIPTPKNIYL